MVKRVIAQSISEAIDWTQDRMRSTRPIAETVLFSMIKDRKITERNEGFIFEASEDDDDDDKDMDTRKRSRTRFNYTTRRKGFVQRREIMRQRLKAMGYSDEAEEMHYGSRKHPDKHDSVYDESLERSPTWINVSRAKLPTGWV
jgi:hypothetical protein